MVEVVRKPGRKALFEGVESKVPEKLERPEGVEEIIRQSIITSEKVSRSFDEATATVQQVAQTVQQLAKTSQEQVKQVEETTKVVTDMNAAIQQLTSGAGITAIATTKAAEIAREGAKLAGRGLKAMEEIREIIDTSAANVGGIGERYREISEVVDIIRGVSDQTNLLALNAAIEAARAGEAGRGFAVVADEVRKLAESSTRQADRISKVIAALTKPTEEAVSSMKIGAEKVAESSAVISSALAGLQEITVEIEKASTKAQDISAASQQLATGAQQVVNTINKITAASQETAAGTEEISAVTEEQLSTMQEAGETAKELLKELKKFQGEAPPSKALE